jgi:hypothetical protein
MVVHETLKAARTRVTNVSRILASQHTYVCLLVDRKNGNKAANVAAAEARDNVLLESEIKIGTEKAALAKFPITRLGRSRFAAVNPAALS